MRICGRVYGKKDYYRHYTSEPVENLVEWLHEDALYTSVTKHKMVNAILSSPIIWGTLWRYIAFIAMLVDKQTMI